MNDLIDQDIEDREGLVRRAVFGEQVAQFLATDIGRYIMVRAESQELEAMKKLKKCEAEDAKLVRKYQNEAEVASSMVKWLGDAVSDGLAALKLLEDRE